MTNASRWGVSQRLLSEGASDISSRGVVNVVCYRFRNHIRSLADSKRYQKIVRGRSSCGILCTLCTNGIDYNGTVSTQNVGFVTVSPGRMLILLLL